MSVPKLALAGSSNVRSVTVHPTNKMAVQSSGSLEVNYERTCQICKMSVVPQHASFVFGRVFVNGIAPRY